MGVLIVKKYCVTERWIVEVSYHVEAESEADANIAVCECVEPVKEEWADVLETIIKEV